MQLHIRRSILVSGVVVILAMATATYSLAAPFALIRACVNNNSGAIKIVDAGAVCSTNEHLITWQEGAVDLGPIAAQIAALQQQLAGLQPMPVASGGTAGATVTVGPPGGTGDFGGFQLLVDGTDVDGPSGTPGHHGHVRIALTGPSFCSVHGPGVAASDLDSLFPLQQVECGTANGQTVSIVGCTARISAHGYLHIDHPWNFLGMSTIDLQITKTPGSSNGTVNLVTYTPRGKVTMQGTGGPMAMSTCP